MAVQHIDKSVSEFSTEFSDPWSIIADGFKVKVDGLQSEQVLSSAARLNIVNVYSGFDLYLTAYRKEYVNLFKIDWKCDRSDTPLNEFRKNINLSEIEALLEVNPYIIKLIDYYRLVRNGVVHPSEENKISVSSFFEKESDSFKAVRVHYGMASAPNSFDSLNFHDVKLFCRILLDILPLFDEKLDPGNELLKGTIPIKSWLQHKESRKKNYEIGFLTNTYGISKRRSEEILAY